MPSTAIGAALTKADHEGVTRVVSIVDLLSERERRAGIYEAARIARGATGVAQLRNGEPPAGTVIGWIATHLNPRYSGLNVISGAIHPTKAGALAEAVAAISTQGLLAGVAGVGAPVRPEE